MERGKIVGDFRTLNALARAGFVCLNGNPKSRERHWTGWEARVITVQYGPKLLDPYKSFIHRGNLYRIE